MHIPALPLAVQLCAVSFTHTHAARCISMQYCVHSVLGWGPIRTHSAKHTVSQTATTCVLRGSISQTVSICLQTKESHCKARIMHALQCHSHAQIKQNYSASSIIRPTHFMFITACNQPQSAPHQRPMFCFASNRLWVLARAIERCSASWQFEMEDLHQHSLNLKKDQPLIYCETCC